MINFHIAYDGGDSRLGSFFEECKNDLVTFIQATGEDHVLDEMHSRLCNQVHISVRLPQVNFQNFLFIAYSHGIATALTVDGHAFVEEGVNSALFVNSLFYSTACLAGARLGRDLIQNGCHTFVGNSREVEALINDQKALSIQMDNLAITMFILGKSIGEAVRLTKSRYTEKIKHFRRIGDLKVALALIDCRESLVLYGNPDLTISDFSF